MAARVLESFDVSLESARARVLKDIPLGQTKLEGQLPFTPYAKRVLEHSLREALSLGHNYIGTEHILLALVRDADLFLGEGRLIDDGQKIREEVLRMLSSPGRASGHEPTETRPSRRTPSYDDVRDGMWRLRLRHAVYPELRGVLASYEFEADRCVVSLSFSGVEGEFKARRTDLVVDV